MYEAFVSVTHFVHYLIMYRIFLYPDDNPQLLVKTYCLRTIYNFLKKIFALIFLT